MANFEQLSFLVVNRNTNMTRILRNVLRGLGTEDVYEASNNTEAKSAVEAATMLDFILLDPVMEGRKTGYDFVKWLRQDPKSPNPHIPIIAISAAASKDDVLEAVKNGVDEFISIPMAPIELIRRVSKIIYKPHPYIRAPGYFGPCRRRHEDAHYSGEERRSTTPKEVDGNTVLPPAHGNAA